MLPNLITLRHFWSRLSAWWLCLNKENRRTILVFSFLLIAGFLSFLALLFSLSAKNTTPAAIIVSSTPAAYSTLNVDDKPVALIHDANSERIILFREQGWTCIIGGIDLSQHNLLEEQIRNFRNRGYSNNCIPGG